jgi:hypothetical protein
MLSKIVSTMTSASFRLSSTARETSSIKSAFVIIYSRPLPAMSGSFVKISFHQGAFYTLCLALAVKSLSARHDAG